MVRWPASIRLTFIAVLILIAEAAAARTTRQYVGVDIPKHVPFPAGKVFVGSDSLFLDGRQLQRERDYVLNREGGYLDLASLTFLPQDTLLVVYHELPVWVQTSYGRPIPELTQTSTSTAIPPPTSTAPRSTSFGSEVKLSGAKSFRMSARTAGSSEFSQSLDLKISGELSPGLELSGAISDRGYDPAYGTANSRLNELDKVNLQVKSSRLLAQLGDITIGGASGRETKQVSGAAFNLAYPTWDMNAAAARPKGRFTTITLAGEDGFQGPYQVGGSGSGAPIVPGSETVWLDGNSLQRGSDKDYTVDYPLGEITFNVNHPIDRRSRIEVDYEPLLTAYKGELEALGGGVHARDSLFYASANFVREGDDRNQPLLGDLSNSDRALLQAAGNRDVYRSGVVPDTLGDYNLIADSLPDSVYQYVGKGYGRLRITFSFVGTGKGDYRYLGNGDYQFAGRSAADYLPVVIIPRPERTDYYQAVLGVQKASLGALSFDLRQSRHDANLLSNIGDENNSASFYLASASRDWKWYGRDNRAFASYRFRQTAFQSRERIDTVDFARDFLLPANFVASSDEALTRSGLVTSPLSFLSLSADYSSLDYRHGFSAHTGGASARLEAGSRFTLGGGWRGLTSELPGSTLDGKGLVNTYDVSERYSFTKSLAWENSVERDSRENRYADAPHGTRFLKGQSTLFASHEQLGYEFYTEDSLISDWSRQLRRNRVQATSNRRFGGFGYNATASYQWLNQTEGDVNSFLGRTAMTYTNTRRRINASASYLVSDELRSERGITYLQVAPGRGAFRLENGLYIPDPDGDYIAVEEVLSSRARVRRGQKSFEFDKEFDQALIRLNSEIQEELLTDGKRSALWIVPFYSDETQPYLFYSRHYSADLRFIAWSGFHAINILVTEDREKRTIVDSDRPRRDFKGRLLLKQASAPLYFDESFESFTFKRDDYYTGGGDVSGYQLSFNIRRSTSLGDLNSGVNVRQAKSSIDERSALVALTEGARIRVWRKGEIRADLEMYHQSLTNVTATTSYLLTDTHDGSRGAIWTMAANYGVTEELRINFSINGRYSDDRAARITARSEVITGF
ncbi:MAG TPA: hypothetical protein VMS71_07615 [Candidatus Acidoferrum sp.]|nr:hypothetical protein [Candidatus Acidoferrum sp.]